MSILEINLQDENFSAVKRTLFILSGKTRLDILRAISDGREWTMNDIARKLGLKISNVSQQVTELERAGLITRDFSQTKLRNSKIIRPVYKKLVINLGK